jgi:hypothetical protein
MRSVQIPIRVTLEERAAIEAGRGDEPRESFIRRAVKELLASGGHLMHVPVADPAVVAPKGTHVLGTEGVLERVLAEVEAEEAERARQA